MKLLSFDRALRNPRFTQWAERDQRWAQRMFKASQYPLLQQTLIGASWLGDGIFWYALIAAVAFAGGTEGRDVAMHMVLAGAINLTIYLSIKRAVSRPRPFVRCSGITACARTLDQFSFPSGHTLHATTFTIVLFNYYPVATLALLPVTALIAFSRVGLGLHYPSDVAAGLAIGSFVAGLILALY